MSKFKAPTGQLLIRHIFFEYAPRDQKENILYTIKREDYKGYPSLYKLYMEMDDPTEYYFAEKYMYDWAYWQKLSNATFFKPFVEEWREELEVRYQAKALNQIVLEAREPSNKNAYAANKFLLARGWKDKPKPITRTAKEKIKKEAQDITLENSNLVDDFERVMN